MPSRRSTSGANSPKRAGLISYGTRASPACGAAELVGLTPDAILASPAPAVAALRQRTHTIPIVFTRARPRRAGLCSEPRAARVAAIFDPDTAFLPLSQREIEVAAAALGIAVTLAPVHDNAALEEAIATQAREPGGSLIILLDSFNEAHRDVIVAATARHGLPLIGSPQFARAGGLMSYLYDPIALDARAASYIDRILRGASPADLPVRRPTKYSPIISLKTAKALRSGDHARPG